MPDPKTPVKPGPQVYPYMWSWLCPVCEMQGEEYDDEEFAKQEAREHRHEDWSA